MGRAIEFAADEVVAAGRAMLARGVSVTAGGLRTEVGRGRPDTLLRVWEGHAATLVAEPRVEVAPLPLELAERLQQTSTEITARLAALAGEMNAAAIKNADERVHQVTTAAAAEKEKTTQSTIEMSNVIESLEGELEASRSRAAGLEAQLQESKTANQAQAVALAQVRERVVMTEQNAQVAEAAHARALQAAGEQHSAVVNRMNALNQERQQELDQLRSELAAMTTKAQAAEQAVVELRERSVREADRHGKQAAERIAKAEDAQVQAAKDAATAREEAAQLRGELARFAKAENAQVQAAKDAATAREEAAQLRGELVATKTQAEQLLRALKLQRQPKDGERGGA